MGTGIYESKFRKDGLFGVEIDGSKMNFPSYCVVNKKYSDSLKLASDLSDEGNTCTIWCTSEPANVCVDIYSHQY